MGEEGGVLKGNSEGGKVSSGTAPARCFQGRSTHFTYEASRSSLTKPGTDLGDAHFAKPAAYTMKCCNSDCSGPLQGTHDVEEETSN